MRSRKLANVNMEVLMTVLTELNSRNINEFQTKGLYLKFLEEIKFPMTISWRENSGGWTYKNFDRQNFYDGRNYEPVMNWLEDRKIISCEPYIRGTKQQCYKYKVNHSAMAELDDFSPIYHTAQ